MYNVDNPINNSEKSGNVSMIVLSFISLAIAVFGYIVFKYGR